MKAGNMKKSLLALVGAGIGLFAIASSAQAGFVITATKTVSGAFDVWQVSAQNDGQGGTGTQLIGLNINLQTVTALGAPTSDSGTAFRVDFATDNSGDGINDANIFGGAPTGAGRAFGNALGTFVRLGNNTSNWSAPAAGQSPSPFESDPDGDGITDTAIAAAYSNLHQLHIEGITLLGADASAAPGLKFANVVVPTGVAFTVSGSILGNLGEFTSIGTNQFPTVPEPSSMAVIGLAIGGLIARRRKA